MLAACLPLAALPLCVAPAPETLLVPEQYPDIQTALNAASDGDRVSIAPGIYHENLLVPPLNIELSGRHSAEATILDGGGAGPVVRTDWPAGPDLVLRLEQLTVRSGAAPSGGGVQFFVGSPDDQRLVMHSCIVRDNVAQSSGGGISTQGVFELVNTTLSDNEVTGGTTGGGGLYMNTAVSECRLTHCTVTGNDIPAAAFGAGVYAYAGRLRVVKSILFDNTSGLEADPLDWWWWLPVVNYTNFEGAPALDLGVGNSAEDPRFVAPQHGDYHLRPGSPCIDSANCGTGSVDVDREGDARPTGACRDRGADEWAPHLYHLDHVSNGADLELRVAGLPVGTDVTIWLDLALRDTPVPTAFGPYWLETRRSPVAWTQAVPPSGTLRVSVELSPWLLPGTPLYAQALGATALTNYDAMLVR